MMFLKVGNSAINLDLIEDIYHNQNNNSVVFLGNSGGDSERVVALFSESKNPEEYTAVLHWIEKGMRMQTNHTYLAMDVVGWYRWDTIELSS